MLKNTALSLLLLALSSLSFYACRQPDGPSANLSLPDSCAYDDRQAIDTIAAQRGTVVLFNASSNLYIIVLDSNSTRIGPCNLPEQVSNDGTRVIVSGTFREIYFNDPRWTAAPFKLSAVRREN